MMRGTLPDIHHSAFRIHRFNYALPHGRATATDLHSARLPTPATEDQSADDGERRECNRDGEEDSLRPHLEDEGQRVGQRNLPQPEDEEVDDGGRARVARAVERLRQDHAVGVEEEAAGDGSQAGHAVVLDQRPGPALREDADDGPGEEYEDEADD